MAAFNTSSTVALLIVLVMSCFSLLLPYYQCSFLTALFCWPFAVLLSYTVCRVYRGFPAVRTKKERNKTTATATGNQSGPRYTLVAMPVNHFGEKVRWTLDLLEADYEEENMAGILSIILRGRSVPWLVDNLFCSHIGNSDQAVHYLGAVHTIDKADARAAIKTALMQRNDSTKEWEEGLNDMGHAVQGWAYYYILAPNSPSSKKTIEPALVAWGSQEPLVPQWQRLVLHFGQYFIGKLLTKSLRLMDEKKCQERKQLILSMCDRVDAALVASSAKSKKTAQQQRGVPPFGFITGPELSYVDVTFASLLAPLLSARLLFGQQSLYARGRFSSFAGQFDRISALPGGGGWPMEVAAMEKMLLTRPCGQHVVWLYENMRLPAPASVV